MRNIADVGVRRTFATYVDVEGIELVFIRISPGPNNALLSGLLWAEKASFLFRVAPGPNSALTVTAYPGLEKK
jgi:hypothetical protein